MQYPLSLELDENGNLKLCPVLDWAVGPGTGQFVLFRAQYIELEGEFGVQKTVQLAVLPEEMLKLADALRLQVLRMVKPSSEARH